MNKVLLVDDGTVGSTFANDLLQNTKLGELVICDVIKEQPLGDSMDLEDITPFTGSTSVHVGGYSDAKDVDAVVITTSIPRKPGETRLGLANKDVKILKGIARPAVDSGFNGIFIVSANPVDILTIPTQKLSGFPKNRIIGTGTSLDSARLRIELTKKLNVKVEDANAYVLGRHGDTSFENFDKAIIAGKTLTPYSAISADVLTAIESDVHKEGGEIIAEKDATFYGVATMLAQIVKAVLKNKEIYLPLSAPITGQYGIKYDLYLDTPAAVNADGTSHIVEAELSSRKLTKMQNSADKIQEVLAGVEE